MLLQGKIIAESIKKSIADTITKRQIKPGLATVLIGSDPASHTYIQSKIKICAEIGFYSRYVKLDDSCNTQEVLATIEDLNNDPLIHGILVQFPLPSHIDSVAVITAINPHKDVDCLHPTNLGLFFSGQNKEFAPCTPTGIMTLLDSIPQFSLQGKNALVMGRSNLVGKPMGILLMNRNATVTYAHSYTKDILLYTKNADIVIVATGQMNIINGDMLKDGVVVIDVGIHRIFDPKTGKKKIVGDVDFESVKDKALAITPVPGGVGPMTIVSLLSNTLKLALK